MFGLQDTNQLRKATYSFKCSTLAKLRQTVQDLRDNLSLALQALDLRIDLTCISDVDDKQLIAASLLCGKQEQQFASFMC